MSDCTTEPDDTATVHAYAALKPDGRIDADTVRSTVAAATHDAGLSAVAVVEVEVSLAPTDNEDAAL